MQDFQERERQNQRDRIQQQIADRLQQVVQQLEQVNRSLAGVADAIRQAAAVHR